jgi:hypothetical protein
MPSKLELVFQDYWQPSWRILVAIIAVLDIMHCWPVLVEGWWSSRETTKVNENFLGEFLNKLNPHHHHNNKNNSSDVDLCPVNAAAAAAATSTVHLSIGWIFCLFCIVEAILRALEARQLALDNDALDRFEQKLANLYSATRSNVFRQQPTMEDYRSTSSSSSSNSTRSNASDDSLYRRLAKNTIRVWTPVASILFGWCLLLPWSRLLLLHCSDVWDNCREDPSFATYGITSSMASLSLFWQILQDGVRSFIWNLALPMALFQKPLALWRRIRLLSKWIRYLRFSGPIIRMALKIQDQLWVVSKTWSQSWHVHTERAKRLARRSMLFDDIQKIESLVQVQTAISNIPSRLFQMASRADLTHLLQQKHMERHQLRERLDSLKKDVGQSSHRSSELYDRVVDLYQEAKRTMGQAVWNAHLISPQTRFSVGWRITVTMALLAELARLFMSWQRSRSFDLRHTDLTQLFLLDCEDKSRPVRRFFARLFRKHQHHDTPRSWCSPSSQSGWLLLGMARGTEVSLDLVCFLDIFVWFFTGELDSQGVVIPKHFVARCIIPGTLMQVLDHPTLPGTLPQLLTYLWDAVHSVGYGRAIRWALGIGPAIHLIVLQPLLVYLFRPMDREEFSRYTESLVLLPASFSTNMIHRPSAAWASRLSMAKGLADSVAPSQIPPSSPKRTPKTYLPQGIDPFWLPAPRVELSNSYGNFLTTIDDDDDDSPRRAISSSRLDDSVGYGLYY